MAHCHSADRECVAGEVVAARPESTWPGTGLAGANAGIGSVSEWRVTRPGAGGDASQIAFWTVCEDVEYLVPQDARN